MTRDSGWAFRSQQFGHEAEMRGLEASERGYTALGQGIAQAGKSIASIPQQRMQAEDHQMRQMLAASELASEEMRRQELQQRIQTVAQMRDLDMQRLQRDALEIANEAGRDALDRQRKADKGLISERDYISRIANIEDDYDFETIEGSGFGRLRKRTTEERQERADIRSAERARQEGLTRQDYLDQEHRKILGDQLNRLTDEKEAILGDITMPQTKKDDRLRRLDGEIRVLKSQIGLPSTSDSDDETRVHDPGQATVVPKQFTDEIRQGVRRSLSETIPSMMPHFGPVLQGPGGENVLSAASQVIESLVIDKGMSIEKAFPAFLHDLNTDAQTMGTMLVYGGYSVTDIQAVLMMRFGLDEGQARQVANMVTSKVEKRTGLRREEEK